LLPQQVSRNTESGNVIEAVTEPCVMATGSRISLVGKGWGRSHSMEKEQLRQR
jgi:hypothetical protein